MLGAPLNAFINDWRLSNLVALSPECFLACARPSYRRHRRRLFRSVFSSLPPQRKKNRDKKNRMNGGLEECRVLASCCSRAPIGRTQSVSGGMSSRQTMERRVEKIVTRFYDFRVICP